MSNAKSPCGNRFAVVACCLAELMIFIPVGNAETTTTQAGAFYETRFSVNLRNTPLTDALELIAAKGHLRLKTKGELDGKVSYAIKNSTLEEAMQKIAEANDLEYEVHGKILTVSRKEDETAAPVTRAPASTALPAVPTEERPLVNSNYTYRSIPILYATARDVVGDLQKILQKGESVISDDSNNSVMIFSSEKTFVEAQNFVKLFDRRPLQILIEAQIVETSKSFAQSLGISLGDPMAASGAAPSVGIINPTQPGSNFILRGLLGSMNGRALEANLQAAESRGDAKIVSRPKVFTLNNKKATIHSGITYNIKTLSAVPGVPSAGTTAPNGGGSLTGGVVSIISGLELDVTPSVVGDGLVRLVVKVTNSEPDVASGVDGIPGLNDNSADTSILVHGGQTATMAGLIKKSISNNESGVPWLSHIPVLGWLFKSSQDSDQTSELMIFLTPYVVDAGAVEPASVKPPEKIPETTPETKPEKTSEETLEKPAEKVIEENSAGQPVN